MSDDGWASVDEDELLLAPDDESGSAVSSSSEEEASFATKPRPTAADSLASTLDPAATESLEPTQPFVSAEAAAAADDDNDDDDSRDENTPSKPETAGSAGSAVHGAEFARRFMGRTAPRLSSDSSSEHGSSSSAGSGSGSESVSDSFTSKLVAAKKRRRQPSSASSAAVRRQSLGETPGRVLRNRTTPSAATESSRTTATNNSARRTRVQPPKITPKLRTCPLPAPAQGQTQAPVRAPPPPGSLVFPHQLGALPHDVVVRAASLWAAGRRPPPGRDLLVWTALELIEHAQAAATRCDPRAALAIVGPDVDWIGSADHARVTRVVVDAAAGAGPTADAARGAISDLGDDDTHSSKGRSKHTADADANGTQCSRAAWVAVTAALCDRAVPAGASTRLAGARIPPMSEIIADIQSPPNSSIDADAALELLRLGLVVIDWHVLARRIERRGDDGAEIDDSDHCNDNNNDNKIANNNDENKNDNSSRSNDDPNADQSGEPVEPPPPAWCTGPGSKLLVECFGVDPAELDGVYDAQDEPVDGDDAKDVRQEPPADDADPNSTGAGRDPDGSGGGGDDNGPRFFLSRDPAAVLRHVAPCVDIIHPAAVARAALLLQHCTQTLAEGTLLLAIQRRALRSPSYWKDKNYGITKIDVAGHLHYLNPDTLGL
jgi:hypothetical protein